MRNEVLLKMNSIVFTAIRMHTIIMLLQCKNRFAFLSTHFYTNGLRVNATKAMLSSNLVLNMTSIQSNWKQYDTEKLFVDKI